MAALKKIGIAIVVVIWFGGVVAGIVGFWRASEATLCSEQAAQSSPGCKLGDH